LVSILIGTSGWQYDVWASTFYPEGLAKSRWLDCYAERFATVESNSAFYRLPERTLFEKWAATVPDDFVMSVKASRYLTHIRRLRDPKDPVQRLLKRTAGLGSKLGPILLQLPPTLQYAPELLSQTLSAFPRKVRIAVEFRDSSWFADDVRGILEKHDAAFCLADRKGPLGPIWRNGSWGYVRFHEGRAHPRPE
jgi:uncharacterized protein YecE (DUF72 family)